MFFFNGNIWEVSRTRLIVPSSLEKFLEELTTVMMHSSGMNVPSQCLFFYFCLGKHLIQLSACRSDFLDGRFIDPDESLFREAKRLLLFQVKVDFVPCGVYLQANEPLDFLGCKQ
jgi:hypothetical protein